jgi:hypothetical protein
MMLSDDMSGGGDYIEGARPRGLTEVKMLSAACAKCLQAFCSYRRALPGEPVIAKRISPGRNDWPK